MKQTLVTSYIDPDLDGYASAVAYAEFLEKKGKKAIAGITGEPHEEVEYVLNRFNLERAKEIFDDEFYDEVILVDTSDTNSFEGKINPEKVIEIIDHREIHEAEKFPKAKVQIELVGAAATLIAEKFQQENIAISPRSAILLYSAIISNTLNFKGGVTTVRDKDMALWLRQFIEVPDGYWKECFLAKSDLQGDKLAKRLEGDIAKFVLGGKKISIAQLEIIGAKELVEQRSEEIILILNKSKIKLGLDFIFLNIVELELDKNYFLADDNRIKAILEKVLVVKFKGVVAERNGLIMRKQIVPLIKEELEK